MSENTKTPRIRFKGFTDAWEQRKAETLFISFVEKGFPDLPVLSATQDKGMVYRDDSGKMVFHDKNNEIGYKRVQPGQFVIHLRSFQGGFAHSNILGITSPAYTIFGFKEGESQYDLFWKSIFSSPDFIRRLESVTYGIRDGRSISYDEFLTMKFFIPKYNEQVKIATCLMKIDNLITLHQRKCDKLKNIKAALLEKMFPQGDATTPKIRFKGFTDAWEQRKLGDVAKINMGQSPDGANYTTNPNDAILVQGNADMSDGWVLPRVYTKQITKQAHIGDLIFSVRAPVGEVGKTQYNVVIGRGVAAISGNEFIFQSLKRMNSLGYWTKLAAGSTFESINSDTLKTAEFAIPKENEQTQIGEILLKIDNLITLHQRKFKDFHGGFL